MINVAMNMIEIIIRNVNLSFNVQESLKDFIKIYVAFLINFFRIRLNDIDREVSRFDYVHDFFKFVSNDSIFAKRNQFDDTVRSNDYRNL